MLSSQEILTQQNINKISTEISKIKGVPNGNVGGSAAEGDSGGGIPKNNESREPQNGRNTSQNEARERNAGSGRKNNRNAGGGIPKNNESREPQQPQPPQNEAQPPQNEAQPPQK